MNFDVELLEPEPEPETQPKADRPGDNPAKLSPPKAGDPGPLFFDLETIPDDSRVDSLGFEPLPGVPDETPLSHLLSPNEFLSASLKDMPDLIKGKNPPAKWIDDIAQAEQKGKNRKGVFSVLDSCRGLRDAAANAAAERSKIMSLTPEFCRIAAIGMAVGGGDIQAILCRTPQEEKDALCYWWDVVERVRGPVCGYNILGFDIPVILVRSALLGVTPKRSLANIQPWNQKDAIDLMTCRFGRGKAMKLKDLAKYYNLPVPAGDCDGSQVAELFATDPARLAEYVKSDVEITRSLHRIWSGYFC